MLAFFLHRAAIMLAFFLLRAALWSSFFCPPPMDARQVPGSATLQMILKTEHSWWVTPIWGHPPVMYTGGARRGALTSPAIMSEQASFDPTCNRGKMGWDRRNEKMSAGCLKGRAVWRERPSWLVGLRQGMTFFMCSPLDCHPSVWWPSWVLTFLIWCPSLGGWLLEGEDYGGSILLDWSAFLRVWPSLGRDASDPWWKILNFWHAADWGVPLALPHPRGVRGHPPQENLKMYMLSDALWCILDLKLSK